MTEMEIKLARAMAEAIGGDPDELRTIGLGEDRRTVPYWTMQIHYAQRAIVAHRILNATEG